MKTRKFLFPAVFLLSVIVLVVVYHSLVTSSYNIAINDSGQTDHYYSYQPTLKQQTDGDKRYVSLGMPLYQPWSFGHVFKTHPVKFARVTLVFMDGEMVEAVGDLGLGEMIFFTEYNYDFESDVLSGLKLISDDQIGVAVKINQLDLSKAEDVDTIADSYLTPNSVGWR